MTDVIAHRVSVDEAIKILTQLQNGHSAELIATSLGIRPETVWCVAKVTGLGASQTGPKSYAYCWSTVATCAKSQHA